MTFVPHKPKKMVRVEISEGELFILKELRKQQFGQFVVHKADNILVRIETRDSKLIPGG